MVYVESCIKRKRHVSFRELLGAGHTKMQMVITFLVILELMKMGKISIVQEHTFDDILIDWREDAGRHAGPDLRVRFYIRRDTFGREKAKSSH